MTREGRVAMVLMAGFSLAWVLLEEVVGTRLQGRYSLMQIVWCRYGFHLLALLLMFGWRKPARLWRTRRPAFQLARSSLMLVMPLSFALSLQSQLQPGTVWAVFWLSPLMVLCIAAARGDRARASVWLVSALGCAVSMAIAAPGLEFASSAVVLPLTMALSFAGYVVMTRGLDGESVRANLFYTALGVFLALTPFVPTFWVAPTVGDWLVLASIGVVGLATLYLLDRSVAAAPVSRSVPFVYAHAIGLLAVGWLLFGHAPARHEVALASLLAASLGYLWWQAPRPHTTVLDAPKGRAA